MTPVDSCLTVLLVEDNPDDARLVQKFLANGANGRFVVEWVDRCQAGRERLSKGGIDVVLSDLKLPDSVGLDTFRALHTHAPDVPIVLLTGTYAEEQLAIQALHEGAQDYLLKGQVDGKFLSRALRYAVERKRMEETLRLASEDLTRLSGLKDEFLSTVSHELRTPLAITREGISLVLDGVPGKINDKQHKVLTTAQHNIDRLARLINELLDMSKLEAGKVELHRDRIDLAELLTHVTSAFEPKARAKDLVVKVDAPHAGLAVYADADKITQVLTNLLSNALQFTTQGQITLSARARGEEIVCQVADTGKGIEQEDLPKVFSKFQQFGRTPGAGEKGTGLGLAITKGLIDLHHGTIQVDSEIDKGTTFTFTLPTYTQEAVVEQAVDDAIEEAKRRDGRFSLLLVLRAEIPPLHGSSPERSPTLLEGVEGAVKTILRRKGDTALQTSDGVMVLLPECDDVGALSVKTRIEQAWAASDHPQLVGDATMKIGCATYPDDASSTEDLIAHVRRAMSPATHTGRLRPVTLSALRPADQPQRVG